MVIKCTIITEVLVQWPVNFCAMFAKSGGQISIGFTNTFSKKAMA